MDNNQYVATLTASAFALIGPHVDYAGVHTEAKICAANCVLGRCVCVVSISLLSFFIFLECGLMSGKI